MNDVGEHKINIKYTYPFSDKFTFEASLDRVNLDKRRIDGIRKGKGFVITEPLASIKKAVREVDGIYSPRYGPNLNDVNSYGQKHRCACGFYTGRIYLGLTCPKCDTKCKFVDDDFEYYGWIVLRDYYIIHPNLFETIKALVGKDIIDDILKPIDEKDKDGHRRKSHTKVPKDNPYKGLGIIDFKDRFWEIMDFFVAQSPAKRKYYDDLKKYEDMIFIQSIPVYTTVLRPIKIEDGKLFFEDTNAIYNMMAKLGADINKTDTNLYRLKKPKNKLLYDLHCKYCELYASLIASLSGKKGDLRSLFGGRYNFTSRDVIVGNPKLRINECTMPYIAMCELLQQTIINILQKSYNMLYIDAYNKWYRAKLEKDPIIEKIIRGLIVDRQRKGEPGIGMIVNRNPSINYGSLLLLHVVDITDDYTLGMPLQVLPLLAADFDGDVLNVLYIINKQFYNAAREIIDPRNAMYINRNDGYLNTDVMWNKDTMIASTSFVDLARNAYTPEQLEKIRRLKAM